MKSARLFLPLITLALLAGCSSVTGMFSEEDPPLEGERLSVLELQSALEPDDSAITQQGLVMPAAWRNEFWPQAGGYPNHSMQNLQLREAALQPLWHVDIGEGSTKELPLTAQPIVVNNQIFTMDSLSTLSSFNTTDGKLNWQVSVRDETDDDPVISGGISFSGGFLYVTNGYDEVLAISPTNGEILWRAKIPAPSRAAPSIMDNRVFVTTLDNKLIALDAAKGTVLWDYAGISESAGLIGAASAAANRDIVIPVFSSGEITALRVGNGSVAWSDNLSNLQRAGGLASLPDIKALPVMDKGLVISISFSGKLAAIDERTGTRVWQREIGGSNTPWVAGNHLFVLSSDNDLVALSRETGLIVWVTRLPRFEDEAGREDPIVWTGPLLAGGRLILAGSDGRMIEVNPAKGEILRQWDAGGTIALSPIVAGGMLYLLAEDGTLTAYK